MKLSLQTFLPRFYITRLFGVLGRCRIKLIKNAFIKLIIFLYSIDLSQSQKSDLREFKNFNDFFTRRLKDEARPVHEHPHSITAPVDGFIYQWGLSQLEPMFMAKGFEFSLAALVCSENLAHKMARNPFVCMYLSPRDYHRVHMPMAGRLLQMTYIPGDHYSVDPKVLAKIPGIFSKNERLVCLFETTAGLMAYIMVGAINVSSLNTVWAGRINEERKGQVVVTDYSSEHIYLEKGAELGYFSMGSTVIVIFPPNIQLDATLNINQHCLYGEKIGMIKDCVDVR